MEKEEKIAEFIGIMLGDGNIGIYDCRSNNKIRKHHQLKVTLDSRNREYIDYVFSLMMEVLGAEPSILFKKNENAADVGVYRKDKIMYALNDLGLKISPKWERMEIPSKYAKGKLSLLVLRGLFDTDGSVTIFKNNGIIYPRIEIRLSPCPAKNQILDILKEYGINFKVQNLERGKIKIRISGKEALKNWFSIIGSSNPRYVKRAEPFLE
jgi:intein/homing endonuclease